MSAIASQITSFTIYYSSIYSKRRSKTTSKIRVTGLSEGNSQVTDEFPVQRASNAENISMLWRHQVSLFFSSREMEECRDKQYWLNVHF